MTFKFFTAGVAAVALLGVSYAAEAADMPIKAPYYKGAPRSVVSYYNWTGLYAGINGGYGWGNSYWDVPTGFAIRPKGGMLGGTLGYNYQVGSFVYGLEGDFDWANVKDSAACGAFSCETKNTWLGTFRGRLGYAFDRFLPYVTVGLAFGEIKANNTSVANPGSSKTFTGWTVGGGLEYAFAGNWTAKVEYLYVDLGKFDCGPTCFAGAAVNNVSFKENVVRLGLNYKFSGPVFSRY